jgi:hypothetical protein
MHKLPQIKSIVMIVALLIVMILVVPAQAANPATIDVTVTIQNLSVSASGPIAFGNVTAASVTVSTDSSHVTNDGNIAETYSLNLTNPGGWTAVQASPGVDEYCLSAQFNASQPLAGSFSYANHALSTGSTACSGTKFAGDQTGLAVAATAARYLWLKFEAPSTSTVFTQQTIVVTVTAAVG